MTAPPPSMPRGGARLRGPGRARVVQGLVGAGIAAAAIALLPLHDDAWWLATPLPRQWALAAAAFAAYAALCGWTLWRARRAAALAAAARTLSPGDAGAGTDGAGADAIVVAFATQSGFAEAVAARTAASLRGAGRDVRLVDLADADASALLEGAAPVLFVASTTGEGDPPDRVMAFARALAGDDAPLPRLRYAVLALGDRGYARYCAFGHAIDAALRRRGAQPLFDLVEVDNGDGGALRHWQHHLGVLAGDPAMPDWAPARYARWTLAARDRVNPGSAGAPMHALTLRPAAGEALPGWDAGDIAEIGPRHAAATVDAWLQAQALDGDAAIALDDDGLASGMAYVGHGAKAPLRELLARSRLPDARPADAAADATALAAFASALEPLPHREYSIASLPADGGIDLLVREMRRDDGSPGLGSGWLCVHAPPGDAIDVRIRRNANFHPPATDRPLVLVGNGTGIAGLRAHLRHRAAAAGAAPAWLLFGERGIGSDRPYAGEIAAWLRGGVLARCDLVFSRDAGDGVGVDGAVVSAGYVQDALARESARLAEWTGRGGAVLVCGSLAGMAPAVDRVLRDALGDAAVDALAAGGRYRRDVY